LLKQEYFAHPQGSSAAEFWNLTRNGLYCHFGGHNKVTNNLNDEVTSLSIDETCQQVRLHCSTYDDDLVVCVYMCEVLSLGSALCQVCIYRSVLFIVV
jgi:hypothetical protein